MTPRECLKRADHDPRFFPYLGNHHEYLPRPGCTRGGGVSLASHMGKPLTARLWEDVTERLQAAKLLVYGPGFNEEWTIGHLCVTVIVRLDDNEMVDDIVLYGPIPGPRPEPRPTRSPGGILLPAWRS
jgi:hypothetical protein